jgi:polyketide cyclase/dehydrase/lipid transport protein
VESHTDGPMEAGAKVRETRRFLGKRVQMTREVTAINPPRGSTFTTVSGPVPMSGEYLLERVNGSTRLTATGELDAHGFYKLAEPVIKRMATRELDASLANLKDLLETVDARAALADERVLRA